MSRAKSTSLVAAVVLLACFTGISQAYYHYVHFNMRTGPWVPAYEKFDTNALPNRTVLYFINEPSDVQFVNDDNAAGLISQIRAGAKIWNDVASSELRVALGGVVPAGTQLPAPAIEIAFDEMPPGVLAYGGPQVLADASGSVVPIQRAHVVLNRDLTKRPSYGEAFFGTLVHEFGHALGLQHTLTSSAMSTETTRATSKGRPLGTDDVAGLGVLYPSAQWQAGVGAISGRVTSDGRPVHLASVVALSTNGNAVSSLTLPDGTYRIDGIPPGDYAVYVHSLPPALESKGQTTEANITYPLDADGKPLPPSGPIESVFYPGVRDPQQAKAVAVAAGATVEGIDVSSRSRNALQLHSVETFGFPAQVAIKPPYLATNFGRKFLVAGGVGLTPNGAPAAGLSVSILGGQTLGVKSYAPSNAYAQVDVDVRASLAVSGEGPRHLVFTTPSELYVLPAGFIQTENGPPSIAAVESAPGKGVLLSGVNLSAQTKVLFDGVAGRTREPDEAGRLLVTPPPGFAGAKTTLVAINPDGQSSQFLKTEPAVWTYPSDQPTPAVAQAISVSPSALPAGVESLVYVDAPGVAFADGYVSVAFANPDVQAKRVWVLSPTRLMVTVALGARAASGVSGMVITNGLEVMQLPSALTVQAANPRLPQMSSKLLNIATNTNYAPAGAPVSAQLLNPSLPAGTPGVRLIINDAIVSAIVTPDGTLMLELPRILLPGPAVARLQIGYELGLPFVIEIDAPPPRIVALSVNGDAPDAGRGIRSGDTVSVTVDGLAEIGAAVNPAAVTVKIGTTVINATQVTAGAAAHTVSFTVPAGLTPGALPITVSIDRRTSSAVVFSFS